LSLVVVVKPVALAETVYTAGGSAAKLNSPAELVVTV
jgi:hypothetical protein